MPRWWRVCRLPADFLLVRSCRQQSCAHMCKEPGLVRGLMGFTGGDPRVQPKPWATVAIARCRNTPRATHRGPTGTTDVDPRDQPERWFHVRFMCHRGSKSGQGVTRHVPIPKDRMGNQETNCDAHPVLLTLRFSSVLGQLPTNSLRTLSLSTLPAETPCRLPGGSLSTPWESLRNKSAISAVCPKRAPCTTRMFF